jgi:signal peptidase I
LAAADEGKDASTAHKWFFETRYWLRDLILSVLLAFIVIVFLYQPVQVEGTSMMPHLENHERIFINKFLYRFRAIERGDVVVFRYPLDTSKSYIKRVIGLPGDEVSIRDGHVLVNGKPLSEPYVPASYLDDQSYPTVRVEPIITLCWAIIVALRMTVACGVPSIARTFTAKRFSCTGR